MSAIGTRGMTLAGRYRLENLYEEQLDIAGTEQWYAVDDALGTAVRVLLIGDIPTRADALDAARRTGLLDDAHIVRTLSVGENFVVSEIPLGTSLTGYVHGEGFAPEQAKAVVCELAAILTQVSGRGMRHLRITPSRVRVGDAGDVYLDGIGIDAALAGARTDEYDPASLNNAEAADLVLFLATLLEGAQADETTLEALARDDSLPDDIREVFRRTLSPERLLSPGEVLRSLVPFNRPDLREFPAPVLVAPQLPGGGDSRFGFDPLGGHVRGGAIGRVTLGSSHVSFGAADSERDDAAAATGAEAEAPDVGAGTLAESGTHAGEPSEPDGITAPEEITHAGETAPHTATTPATEAAPDIEVAVATEVVPDSETAPDAAGVSASTATTSASSAIGSQELDPAGVSGANFEGAVDTELGIAAAPDVELHPRWVSPEEFRGEESKVNTAYRDRSETGTEETSAAHIDSHGGQDAAGGGVAQDAATPRFQPHFPSLREAERELEECEREAAENEAAERAAAARVAAERKETEREGAEPASAAPEHESDTAPTVALNSVHSATSPQRRSIMSGTDEERTGSPHGGDESPRIHPASAAARASAAPAKVAARTRGDRKPATRPPAPSRPIITDEENGRALGSRIFDSSKLIVVGAIALVLVALYFAVSTFFRPTDVSTRPPVISAPPTASADAQTSEGQGAQPSASAAPTPSSTAPQIVSANLLNPHKSEADEDYPQTLPLAIDKNPATEWASWEYLRNPKFGLLKEGMGIELRLAKPSTIKEVTLQLSGQGGHVQWRDTTAEQPSGGTVVTEGTMSAKTTLTAPTPVNSDHVVLWFTELPKNAAGQFKLQISEISVK
ncbi:hypothetical protein QP431_02950 [Actinotignum sanguinis]|uniref:hypothetical protein n=2 Tax=Actinomycetaceae TaxID=2049 RepID=UPI00237D41DD|nr:hypothetical protein [Actinotignum sanguinis]MDE1553394.1 hypothetical protein [Actinotignum sanguinis]MDK7197159.1 hypothetical protein [Actinotignum sanguinis]